jgi:trehalose 6-phosphate synthase
MKENAIEAEETPDIVQYLDGGRLVVVSNRLPCAFKRTASGVVIKKSSGGLVTALSPILKSTGGIWIGWDGGGEAEEMQRELVYRAEEGGQPLNLRLLSLTREEVEAYYYGFSNRTLWPLFHNLLESSTFDKQWWNIYLQVNEKFAKAAADVARPQDVLWIHDYHLLMVPFFLRSLKPDLKIAHFLHIPFPPVDLFRCIQWRRELLLGLLSCDLVGFHTGYYLHNFLQCVAALVPEAWVDWKKNVIAYKNRRIRAGDFPISIDVGHFKALSRSEKVINQARRLRKALGDRIIALGVDRLDYTKGIRERLLAIENLLEHHPGLRSRFVFIQVAVPSRTHVKEYHDLKREIDEIVGRINGRFSEAVKIPVHYLYRSIPQDRLVAYYRIADIGLITPLKDGMNLVAKEYVASKKDEEGVLILSEFTGSAAELTRALLVNPYNIDDVTESLLKAIHMSPDEKRERMEAMRRTIRRNDVFKWVQRFLLALPSTAHSKAHNPVIVSRR